MNEVKGEIPGITNLATTVVFITVKNVIPNLSDSVKKANNDGKISEIEKNI